MQTAQVFAATVGVLMLAALSGTTKENPAGSKDNYERTKAKLQYAVYEEQNEDDKSSPKARPGGDAAKEPSGGAKPEGPSSTVDHKTRKQEAPQLPPAQSHQTSLLYRQVPQYPTQQLKTKHPVAQYMLAPPQLKQGIRYPHTALKTSVGQYILSTLQRLQVPRYPKLFSKHPLAQHAVVASNHQRHYLQSSSTLPVAQYVLPAPQQMIRPQLVSKYPAQQYVLVNPYQQYVTRYSHPVPKPVSPQQQVNSQTASTLPLVAVQHLKVIHYPHTVSKHPAVQSIPVSPRYQVTHNPQLAPEHPVKQSITATPEHVHYTVPAVQHLQVIHHTQPSPGQPAAKPIPAPPQDQQAVVPAPEHVRVTHYPQPPPKVPVATVQHLKVIHYPQSTTEPPVVAHHVPDALQQVTRISPKSLATSAFSPPGSNATHHAEAVSHQQQAKHHHEVIHVTQAPHGI